MPTIARPCKSQNVELVIHPGDHAPPHVHLEGPDWEAWIELSTLKVKYGKAPAKELKEAIAYLRANMTFVQSEWRHWCERD